MKTELFMLVICPDIEHFYVDLRLDTSFRSLIYIYLCLAATDTSVKLLQRRCSGMKLYTDYTNITKESTGEIPREVCPGIGEIPCAI